jgi:hypothetical protein
MKFDDLINMFIEDYNVDFNQTGKYPFSIRATKGGPIEPASQPPGFMGARGTGAANERIPPMFYEELPKKDKRDKKKFDKKRKEFLSR